MWLAALFVWYKRLFCFGARRCATKKGFPEWEAAALWAFTKQMHGLTTPLRRRRYKVLQGTHARCRGTGGGKGNCFCLFWVGKNNGCGRHGGLEVPCVCLCVCVEPWTWRDCYDCDNGEDGVSSIPVSYTHL